MGDDRLFTMVLAIAALSSIAYLGLVASVYWDLYRVVQRIQ
jgi:hypothetical protein